MFGKAFEPLAAKIFGGLSIALLLGCVGLGLWGRAESHRADAWKARSELEAANHRQTKTNYRAAQVLAAAKAKAQREATERRFAHLAEEADDAKDTLDRLRDAADRFAARNSLRSCGAAVGGPSGGSGAASEGGPAGDRDGSGADAVVLTRPEFDELVGNSLRLERVRQWGQSLVTEGLAIPAAEFGAAP